VLERLVKDAIMDIAPSTAPVRMSHIPSRLFLHVGPAQTILANIMYTLSKMMWSTPRKKCREFILRLIRAKDPLEMLASTVVGMAVCTAIDVSRGASASFHAAVGER
jgi:hypothetical protein